jgi:hypothetical protein
LKDEETVMKSLQRFQVAAMLTALPGDGGCGAAVINCTTKTVLMTFQ